MKKADFERKADELRQVEKTQSELPSIDELLNTRNTLVSALEPFQRTIDLSELSISDSNAIEMRHNDTKGLLSLKRKELIKTKSQVTKLLLEKEAHESLFERVLQKLHSEEQYSFLSDWIKGLHEETPQIILKSLNQHVTDFLEVASEVQIRTKGVEDYHRALLRIQANHGFTPLDEIGSEVLKFLEAIFNKYLQEFYDNPIFFKYVFEGFVKIKTFNLRTNEISLIDDKGEVQTKPINTFSTGQKAFAFSIAMMSIVFSRPSENKVLILDEFGALLDFMREDVLIKQIKLKIIAQNFVDKIVIILPVRTRLEFELESLNSQLKTATAAESGKIELRRTHVECWLNQLQTRGYYQFEQDENEYDSKSE